MFYQSYVSDMVQANNKKLENIEMFLETLGSKIEGFLTASEVQENELTNGKKRNTGLVSGFITFLHSHHKWVYFEISKILRFPRIILIQELLLFRFTHT